MLETRRLTSPIPEIGAAAGDTLTLSDPHNVTIVSTVSPDTRLADLGPGVVWIQPDRIVYSRSVPRHAIPRFLEQTEEVAR